MGNRLAVMDQYPAGADHLRFAEVDLEPAAIGSSVCRRRSPERQLDRPRPARTICRRIHPIFLSDLRMTAEDCAARSSLGLRRPPGTSRKLGRVIEGGSHHPDLAAQVDPEVIGVA